MTKTNKGPHHALHDADDPLGYETAPPDVQLDPERVKSMMKYNQIGWAKQCPASENEIIEIRQVQEMSDFPPDVQQAASGLTELQGRKK
jgi:hypothetical protein